MFNFKTIQFGLVMCFTMLLHGCSGFLVSGDAPPITTFEPEPYRIGVGDTVNIHVWRSPELSQEIIVRPDGYISMPLMGDVKAEGQEPEALAKEIRAAMSDLIRNPEVTVMVTNPVSKEFRNRVRITGQVATPVSLAFRPGMTVLDLVLQAGGLTDFAAEGRAVLHRETSDGYQSFKLDLDGILNDGDMRSNYVLQPGDVVSIPRKQLFRGEL